MTDTAEARVAAAREAAWSQFADHWVDVQERGFYGTWRAGWESGRAEERARYAALVDLFEPTTNTQGHFCHWCDHQAVYGVEHWCEPLLRRLLEKGRAALKPFERTVRSTDDE